MMKSEDDSVGVVSFCSRCAKNKKKVQRGNELVLCNMFGTSFFFFFPPRKADKFCVVKKFLTLIILEKLQNSL